MRRSQLFLRNSLSILMVLGLFLSTADGALATLATPNTPNSAPPPLADSPLADSPLADSLTLYRTRVTFPNSTSRARLDRLGVVVLDEGPDWALVLADGEQLADLARLRFQPRSTDDLGALVGAYAQDKPWLAQSVQPLLDQAALEYSLSSVADLRTAMQALTPEQQAGIAALASDDSDGDGLTNTEEQWWCTDPEDPNSDSDALGYSDGQEVYALLDFTLPRSVRWGYGPPFGPPAAWPDFNGQDNDDNTPACNDGDKDTIPDFAEAYVVGTRVPGESTDRDKFDDGQELFGITYCDPVGGEHCGYGLLPRDYDYENDFITDEMPRWVLPPGDNPFVAAFPVPEASVVPGSWTVERVTTITTEECEVIETTHSYETSVMRGESTSIANTVTWNEWEEVSQATETPLITFTNYGLQRDTCKPVGSLKCRAFGVGKIVKGHLVSDVGGAISGCAVGVIIGGGPIGCVIGGAAGYVAGSVVDEWGNQISDEGWSDFTGKDQLQTQQGYGQYPPVYINSSSSASANASVTLNQHFDFQGVANSLDGIQYAINQQGELLSRGLQDISYQISRPRYTETRTNGRSWGGAQTTTHEVYEEHTVSKGEAFTTGHCWSTAWAEDSSHAADLTFNYVIENTGTDYAREITGLIFNVYLGDDPNSIISYLAWEQFPNGKVENFFPGDTHNSPSNLIPLTLEQMKRIDLGERLTVVLEDYSYGADELFYKDAVDGGLTVFIEDGVDDGDELVDSYVIPTWGVETVQDVLTRYFPHSVDSDGNLNSLWTAEFDGINPPVWYEHFLSDIAWWNVYLTQSGAGDTPLHELSAQAGGAILFRFNRDSDRDGYQDRVELHYGTEKDDPASHPNPEILAGYVATRARDLVTVKLALENSGSFDAYGIDAVMYAPNDTTTIGNNTVGGNGRVRPAQHVAVGSLILAPDLAHWTNSTAKFYVGGNYAGAEDKTFTFNVVTPGVVGQDSAALSWDDGAGNNGALDLGSAYHPPLPIDVGAEGLQIGFDTGTLMASEWFTVAALTPRDTFTYTINSEPYTPPVIVVSYSDPQGSHRFITPITLTTLTDDLSLYSGQMLPDARLDILTGGELDPVGTNTTHFVINSPHPEPIQDAHLYLNFVANGELVSEMPFTMTVQPGPTVYPVDWSTIAFSQTFDADADNILIAFWTDAQGNIIDSAARPLNTFQADPIAEMHASNLTWDFGTVTQGALLEHTLTLANTSMNSLRAWVAEENPVTLQDAASSLIVYPADVLSVPLTLDTSGLPSGPFSQTLTIRTSDLDHPQTTLQVTGQITDAAPSDHASDQRPLDLNVIIPGDHNAGEWITFTHTLGPDPQSLHPVKVYSQDYGTLWGVGKYATSFGGEGTASYEMFGDGSDGNLTVTANADLNPIRASASGAAGSSILTVSGVTGSGFQTNTLVLIHQSRGTNAGNWEFNRIQSVGSGQLTLHTPLTNTYTTNTEASRAQVLWVPQFRDLTVSVGATVSPSPWDGNTGGIIAFLSNGTTIVAGTISANGGNGSYITGDGVGGGASGGGFRGGNGAANSIGDNSSPARTGRQGEGTDGIGSALTAANGNGGGGASNDGAGRPGGGGGHSSPGGNGSPLGGLGGGTAGTTDLVTMVFGGGGGGGGNDGGNNGTENTGGGGAGGGIVLVASKNIMVTGALTSNGGKGGDTNLGEESAGGGGAGGSILLKGQIISLGPSLVTANPGGGGQNSGVTKGGNGSAGRIRIEYCDIPSGSTNPSASTQKLDCYIIEQIESAPYTTARLSLPEGFTGGHTYQTQYGRQLVFAGAETLNATLRVPARAFGSATLDVLISEVATDTLTFKLDICDDGSWDWQTTQTVTGTLTLSSLDLVAAFNQYWADQGAPTVGTLDVPIRVSLSAAGQVILTNLYAPPLPPDVSLAATGISFDDGAPTEGDHVSIQVVVSNTELLTATNVIAAFFAGDPLADGVYLGADFVRAVPGNGTATATLDWDTEGFGGDASLYVHLDPNGRVVETDEDNNSAFKPIHVKSRADLQVTGLSASQTYPRNGLPVAITAIISNAGETDSSAFTVAFYDNVPGSPGDTLVATATLALPGEMTSTVDAPWTPSGMGVHTLVAIADSDDEVRESNQANNQATQEVFVALYDQFYANSGGSPDPAFDSVAGYGWISGTQTGDWSAWPEPVGSYRWNSSGPIRYRFDYLAPDADYHMDVTLLDGSGGIHSTETLWIDEMEQGSVNLSDGRVHWLSIRPDAVLYGDHSLLADVTSDGMGGAVVSEIAVREIYYRYLNSGPDSTVDPPYSAALGYGYLNGFGGNVWGNTPVETFRSVLTDTILYRFDGLDLARNYQLNVTLYQGDTVDRQQTILFDGISSGVTLVPNSTQATTVLPVPKTVYALDGSVIVGVQRTNGNGPIINAIALEQRTIPWEGNDDWQGPAISDVTFPVRASSTHTVVVSAEISDAETGNHGVSGAWLTYGYSLPFDSFAVAGVAPGGDTGDGTWTFAIPPQGIEREGETLRFAILATDGNDTPETTTDDNGGAYYRIEIASTAASIVKSVTPIGEVRQGDLLTYTLVISATPGEQLALYDPLVNMTLRHFVEQPLGITSVEVNSGTLHIGDVITGALTVTPTGYVMVSFVAQAGVSGTAGLPTSVRNRACIYPPGRTLDACVWSNWVTNFAFQVYLPLVMRNY